MARQRLSAGDRLPRPPDCRQADGWSCGIVTVRVCLELLGWPKVLSEDLAALVPATPLDGCDPRTIEAVFRRFGLAAVAGEMDWRDLAYHTARGRPVACLAQSSGSGHWVTVWRASSRRVRWHCPNAGLRSASPSSFGRDWWDWDRLGVEYRGFGVAVGPGRRG